MQRAVAMFYLLALCSWTSAAAAQDTSCKYDLIPCQDYFNSTRIPPSTCCNPLKILIKSDLLCLCNLLEENPSKKTQAYNLAERCGEKVDDTMCSGKVKMDENKQQTEGTKTEDKKDNSAGKFGFGNQVMAALLLFILTMWL